MPGMNLANSRVQAPRFEKAPSVLRTQVSGSIESLQSSASTGRPRRRPSSYQNVSPARAAADAATAESHKE